MAWLSWTQILRPTQDDLVENIRQQVFLNLIR
jgi:hypothetical protein